MRPSYFSVKVRFSNHVMMGRFRRSLYVGRMTEYFSLEALAGAIVRVLREGGTAREGKTRTMRHACL